MASLPSPDAMVLHDALKDLVLASEEDGETRTRPSALEVLNYLLYNYTLQPRDVRGAIDALSSSSSVSSQAEDTPQSSDQKTTSPPMQKSQEAEAVTTNASDPKSSSSKEKKKQKKQNETTTTTTAATTPRPIRTRHVALRIYYNGGSYSGLAENVGSEKDHSIERALFTALRQAHLVTSRADCGYSRCGRTDKGVSAAGQILAIRLKSAFPPEAVVVVSDKAPTTKDSTDDKEPPLTDQDLPGNSHDKRCVWVHPKKAKQQQKDEWVQKELSEYAYDKILNNLLPPDIRVLGWSPVTPDFSARFSAQARTYRYFFVARPLLLDLNRTQQALQLLVGTHDFRNFCKMDVEKVYNFERTIHSADIVRADDHDTNGGGCCYYFRIVGQAFLWHQIRCVASVLFLVGRGYEEPSVVSELLNVEKYPGKPSYPLADERPLVLHDCQYSNLHMGYSVTNLWNTVCLQEQQWEELVLAAARVRNNIESLLDDANVLTRELTDFCATRLKQREKKGKLRPSTKSDDNNTTLPRPHSFSSETVTWRQALEWLKENGLILDPNTTLTNSVYTPLLQRSKGTTYEEKVAALTSSSSSSKRRQKYEDNVIKKRKTKEQDAAFYAHMTQQGGSAL